MVRGIMLNQLSNVVGENLSVMGFSLFLSWSIETLLLCPVNYGRKRYLLSICLVNLILNAAVIVESNRNFLIFN